MIDFKMVHKDIANAKAVTRGTTPRILCQLWGNDWLAKIVEVFIFGS